MDEGDASKVSVGPVALSTFPRFQSSMLPRRRIAKDDLTRSTIPLCAQTSDINDEQVSVSAVASPRNHLSA